MVEDGSRARVLDVWFGSPFVKHFSEPAFVSIIVSFLLEAGLVFQTKRKNKKKKGHRPSIKQDAMLSCMQNGSETMSRRKKNSKTE